MLHLIRVKPDLHDLVVCSHIYVCIQFLWGLPLFTQLFIHIYSCENVILISLILLVIK